MIRLVWWWIPICLAVGTQACQPKSKAQEIIDRAIAVHGGEAYEKAIISFDFRDVHYQIMKTPSAFEYSREFRDSSGHVLDILNNAGFSRSVNGNKIDLTAERENAYSNSVNAVAYFAFLPYGLNDEAARKTWIKESVLEGQAYDLIRVDFSEEGGGEDFEDEFLYWINKDSGQMDFLAYRYYTDGGGIRFRKAINKRRIQDILFQDYLNYKPANEQLPLEEIEALFKNQALELFTRIEKENVQVEFLAD